MSYLDEIKGQLEQSRKEAFEKDWPSSSSRPSSSRSRTASKTGRKAAKRSPKAGGESDG